MTEDPNRYRFTRAFAGFSLGAIVGISASLIITAITSPEGAAALEKVSGPLIATIGVLGGVIGTYMGVSNNWGKK